jgi:hypothetical protein
MTGSRRLHIKLSLHFGIASQRLVLLAIPSILGLGYVLFVMFLKVTSILIIGQAWTHPEVSGIGAGIDSFYEYALKWYIMSGICSSFPI